MMSEISYCFEDSDYEFPTIDQVVDELLSGDDFIVQGEAIPITKIYQGNQEGFVIIITDIENKVWEFC